MRSSNYRGYIIVGALGALVGAALVKWPSARRPDAARPELLARVEGQAQAPVAQAPAPHIELMKRLAGLEQQLAELQPHAHEAEEPTRPEKTPADMQRESREKEEAFQGRVDGVLEQETRDDAWASAFEATLRTKLTGQAFASVEIQEVACKRNLCRLRVQHKFAEDRDDFPLLFMSEGPSTSEIDATWARENLETSETTIYLSRAGTNALHGLQHEPEGR
jgi:hypothetical protein